MPNRMFYRLESREFFDPSTAVAAELLDIIYSELVHEERIRSWRGVKAGNSIQGQAKDQQKPKEPNQKTTHLTIMEEIPANEYDEEKELRQIVSYYATTEGPSSVVKFKHPNYSFFDREENGTTLTRIFHDPFNDLQKKIKKAQEFAPTQEAIATTYHKTWRRF